MLKNTAKDVESFMVKRSIVVIDEEKCNGCGLCIPACHEGALQIVDGKAKLVKDIYCDGLGNCLGHCPQDAIKIVEKDAKEFDFEATNKHLKEIGKQELEENPLEEKTEKLPCGCPGTMVRDLRGEQNTDSTQISSEEQTSQLKQWPIQLNLLPPNAPFFQNSDLLISADCVGFATPNLHNNLLKGKSIAIGCPKLDNVSEYQEKIQSIIEMSNPKTITVAIMEVPCCHGLYYAVEQATQNSGKEIPVKKIVVGVKGTTKENLSS